jgi:hypothetical protein
LTDKDLERDVWDVEAGVTHHVNAFAALFHLIEVVDYISKKKPACTCTYYALLALIRHL